MRNAVFIECESKINSYIKYNHQNNKVTSRFMYTKSK